MQAPPPPPPPLPPVQKVGSGIAPAPPPPPPPPAAERGAGSSMGAGGAAPRSAGRFEEEDVREEEPRAAPRADAETHSGYGSMGGSRPKSPVVHGTYERGDSDEEEVMVKTEFVWADGAEHDVKLSGAWNGWMPVQMYHEGGGMWSVVTPVPAGTHEFKFVVDGEWKHSTRHPTVGEDEETMNNIRVIRGPPKSKQNTARLSEQRNKESGQPAPRKKACCVVS